MIRLFNVYYPVRTLVLLIGEALIVGASLLLGAFFELRENTYHVLMGERGAFKIVAITVLVLLCSHWLDLYDTARLNTTGELYFRLLMVLGVLAFIMAGVAYVRPDYLSGSGSSAVGLLILTVALIGWRLGYAWLVQLPILVERVYVVGTGERALRVVQRRNGDLDRRAQSTFGDEQRFAGQRDFHAIPQRGVGRVGYLRLAG